MSHHPHRPVRRWLLAPVLARLADLETFIMTRADDLVARLNAATDEVASDLAAAVQAVRDAAANADAATAAALNTALDKFEAPISRVEALGADESDPVPAPPVEDPAAPTV